MTAASHSPQLFRRDAQVIGLVGVAHGTSHFYHLLLAPLFPWIKEAFALSYAELGFLLTVFFVVSGVGQALAGFLVDRVGAFKVLVGGIVVLGLSAIGLSLADHYLGLVACSALTGLGNCIFHPADFTLLNRRVSQPRLAHAFSFHGIAGSIGWAAAPPFLAGIAALSSWRTALLAASALAFAVAGMLLVYRDSLDSMEVESAVVKRTPEKATNLAFLRLPAVWMCFGFFALTAMALGGIQSFAATALHESYGVSMALAAAGITAYMLANAAGTLAGGFVAARYPQHDRVIAMAFLSAAAVSLLIASGAAPAASIPLLLALIGFGSGVAGPSRDLLVRAAAPKNATGRVYGVVYSGLDVGLSIVAPVYGAMMDAHHPLWVFVLIGVFQALALFTALGVGSKTTVHAQPA